MKVLNANMSRVLGGLFVKEILGRSEGDYMTRYHLTPWDWWPWKKRVFLHVYQQPDNDPHPHDHPFGFRSIILLGGYTEWVFPYEVREGGRVLVKNGGVPTQIRRRVGRTFKVPAVHVHMIKYLHGCKTVTLLIRGEKEQDWGFFVHTFEQGMVKVPGWKYIGLPEPEKPAYQ